MTIEVGRVEAEGASAVARARGTLRVGPASLQWAVVALIVALAAWVRFEPQRDAVPVATGYGTYVDWGGHWLLRTGRLYRPGEIEAPSAYARGIAYGSLDIFAKTLDASVAHSTGYGGLEERSRLMRLLPWAGALFVPLSALILFAEVSRQLARSRASTADLAMLFLFAALPSSALIAATRVGGYGDHVARGLMAVLLSQVLLRAFKGGKVSVPEVVAFLVVLTGLQLYYHTAIMYFAIIVLTLVLGLLVLGRGDLVPGNTVLVVLLAAVAVHAYVNTAFFHNYVLMAKTVIEDARRINTQGELAGVVPHRAVWVTALNLLNTASTLAIGLVLLPRLWARRGELRRRGGAPLHPDVIVALFLASALPIAALVGVWAGPGEVYGRLSALGGLMLTMVAGYMLATRRNRWEGVLLRALMGAAVAAALVTYGSDELLSLHELTHAEDRAGAYVPSAAPPRQAVFSDFRIATPLLYRGVYGITGIDSEYRPHANTRRLIHAVYQNGTPAEAARELDEVVGAEEYLLLTSAEQARSGVSDAGALFRPAGPRFQEKLIASEEFDTLYSSGETTVFRRAPASEGGE